jgi:hypothetical protein
MSSGSTATGRFFLSSSTPIPAEFKDEGLATSPRVRAPWPGHGHAAPGPERARGQAHYLETLVQHVGIGLLVFQPDGRVELINNAAKRLLRVPWLKNVEALRSFSPELVETLLRLPAQEKGFVRIARENETLTLALSATEFRLRGGDFRLVSLQNIQRELEEKEMEAWQKSGYTMIMNSVTSSRRWPRRSALAAGVSRAGLAGPRRRAPGHPEGARTSKAWGCSTLRGLSIADPASKPESARSSGSSPGSAG